MNSRETGLSTTCDTTVVFCQTRVPSSWNITWNIYMETNGEKDTCEAEMRSQEDWWRVTSSFNIVNISNCSSHIDSRRFFSRSIQIYLWVYHCTVISLLTCSFSSKKARNSKPWIATTTHPLFAFAWPPRVAGLRVLEDLQLKEAFFHLVINRDCDAFMTI